MSETTSVLSSHRRNLGLAAIAALTGGCAFWGSQHHLKIGDPVIWQGGAIVAALLAGMLTVKATTTWRQLRTQVGQLAQESPAPLLALPPPQAVAEARQEAKIQTPENPVPKPESAEAERDRLREEIAKLSAAKTASSSPPGATALGSGVATGLVSNIDAVVTYARSALPSLKTDIDRMLDPHASTGDRAGSAVGLTVKTLALIAIGYFVYIEALQMRSVAYKSWAEACIERQKNAINFTPMNELLSGSATASLDKECRP